jgi:hypothetical protein
MLSFLIYSDTITWLDRDIEHSCLCKEKNAKKYLYEDLISVMPNFNIKFNHHYMPCQCFYEMYCVVLRR